VRYPGAVTPELMTAFAERMRERGLAVPTINERILKVRAIYKIAVGKHVLKDNPAAGTIGFKQAAAKQRQKRRLPFDAADLRALFGSPVFNEHKRSMGQSGEASYWLPVLMFYTGARPEELAGLALSCLQSDDKFGWYLNLVDRPGDEDADLFEEGDVSKSHRRTLKNAPSVRRVPVAQGLIDLGLLRYVDWMRQSGAAVLYVGTHGAIWGLSERISAFADDHPLARHFLWVFGARDMAEVCRLAEKFDLRSVLPGMKCPYLIIHGGHDVLGVEAAGKLHEAAKAAGIDVSLRIVSEEETGADHCQHDNPTLGQELMLDWLADRLGH